MRGTLVERRPWPILPTARLQTVSRASSGTPNVVAPVLGGSPGPSPEVTHVFVGPVRDQLWAHDGISSAREPVRRSPSGS
jgi:hypothetical protein